MQFDFWKYHGTGNDFVMIDNRKGLFSGEEQELFEAICHRRFGVGADGLILLNTHPDYDFEMYYVNADGRPTSMCGNGGRCVVRFAQQLGIVREHYRFIAIDGPHEAILTELASNSKWACPMAFSNWKTAIFGSIPVLPIMFLS